MSPQWLPSGSPVTPQWLPSGSPWHLEVHMHVHGQGWRSDHCTSFLLLYRLTSSLCSNHSGLLFILAPSVGCSLTAQVLSTALCLAAPSHFSDASPSEPPLRDAFPGYPLSGSTAWPCPILFIAYPAWEFLALVPDCLSALDSKLFEGSKPGQCPPVGSPASRTVAIVPPTP